MSAPVDAVVHASRSKPTLGLMPRWRMLELYVEQANECMIRYQQSGQPIPPEVDQDISWALIELEYAMRRRTPMTLASRFRAWRERRRLREVFGTHKFLCCMFNLSGR